MRRQSTRPGFTLLLAAMLLVGLWIGVAHARDRHDHDQARRALEAGEVMPLRALLEKVERDYPGQVLEVELDREDTLWVYEITVLRTGGKLIRLKLDGKTGGVLSSREPHDRGNRDNHENYGKPNGAER